MSNSDIHNPLNLDYDVHDGDHRPLTLVFARDAGVESIREALFDRRTVVYSGDRLIGEARFLKPIFEASIQVLQQPVEFKGKQSRNLQIHNASDIPYDLEKNIAKPEELSVPARIVLAPRRTVLFQVRSLVSTRSEELEVKPVYRIRNLLVGPEEGLEVELPFRARFRPE
jgi:hypothetical protein